MSKHGGFSDLARERTYRKRTGNWYGTFEEEIAASKATHRRTMAALPDISDNCYEDKRGRGMRSDDMHLVAAFVLGIIGIAFALFIV